MIFIDDFRTNQVVRSSRGSGEHALISLLGRTDMVRGKKGYDNGVHMWEIHWPKEYRGSNAVIGVATTEAPISCVGQCGL